MAAGSLIRQFLHPQRWDDIMVSQRHDELFILKDKLKIVSKL